MSVHTQRGLKLSRIRRSCELGEYGVFEVETACEVLAVWICAGKGPYKIAGIIWAGAS
jgi:hypothetical protein